MNEEKELISKSRLCQTLNILIKKEVDIYILFISKDYDMYNSLMYRQSYYTNDKLCIFDSEAISNRYLTYDEFNLLKIELQGGV